MTINRKIKLLTTNLPKMKLKTPTMKPINMKLSVLCKFSYVTSQIDNRIVTSSSNRCLIWITVFLIVQSNRKWTLLQIVISIVSRSWDLTKGGVILISTSWLRARTTKEMIASGWIIGHISENQEMKWLNSIWCNNRINLFKMTTTWVLEWEMTILKLRWVAQCQ